MAFRLPRRQARLHARTTRARPAFPSNRHLARQMVSYRSYRAPRPPAVLDPQYLLPNPLHVLLLPGPEPGAADALDGRNRDLLRDDVTVQGHQADAEHLRRLARGVGF